MTAQTSQPSDKRREQVANTRKGQITDANTLRRGDFATGEATVLVVDYIQRGWKLYDQRVPQEANLLFVRDIESAVRALHENPAIGVVIVQGMSRQITDSVVDQLTLMNSGGSALYNWLRQLQEQGESTRKYLASHENTLDFLEFLQQRDFKGLVQIVSNSLEYAARQELLSVENLRVQYMNKQNFFLGRFIESPYTSNSRSAEDHLFYRWGVALRYLDRHPSTALLYSRYSAAAEACELALTCLEQLKAVIKAGDVRAIYNFASQYPQDPNGCDCEPEEVAYHRLHGLDNSAVWSILDESGLMQWMQLELELDLASRNREFPEFGHHIRHDRGCELRSFFSKKPAHDWFK